MLEIRGNDICRESQKVGWLEGNHLFDRTGKKLGYFDGAHVYNADAEKIATIEGDKLVDESGNRKIALEAVTEAIEGVLPETAKCAVYVLLGD